jgi:uncharacterized protein
MKSAYVIIICLSVVLVSASPPALAQSFDCKKARSPHEKAICRSDELKSLDSKLAASYKGALSKSLDKQSLLNEQRLWLKVTAKCRTNVDCLKIAYTKRTAELDGKGGAQLPPVARQNLKPTPAALNTAPVAQKKVDLGRISEMANSVLASGFHQHSYMNEEKFKQIVLVKEDPALPTISCGFTDRHGRIEVNSTLHLDKVSPTAFAKLDPTTKTAIFKSWFACVPFPEGPERKAFVMPVLRVITGQASFEELERGIVVNGRRLSMVSTDSEIVWAIGGI